MSHSTDLSNNWRRKRDPRRESTAIFSALLRTSEQQKGLLDENELAVGDDDIIIPLHKASMVHQGVKSAGCLVVEPDTEADMLEHDALHDALALGRQIQGDLELDQYEAKSSSRSSMLLAIPEENGKLPDDDDQLLLSAGSQTTEGAEDSWLVPVKRDDDNNDSIFCDPSNDDDMISKREIKIGCSTNSKKEEGALIKAIREDVSRVKNMCSGSYIDVASIDTMGTISKENAPSVCKNSSTENKKGTISSTRVPARPPSRLKHPSSRSNFFSETRDVGERKDARCTSKSESDIRSFGIDNSIKRSSQNKTTASSSGCCKTIEDGHTSAAHAKPKSVARPKKFGSLDSKREKTGKPTRHNNTSDQVKQINAFSKSQSSGQAGPSEASRIDSCINQPRENRSSGSHTPDSFKSPLIDKKKMEEGSHAKESPVTARLRWLEMNPHLAFGGGSKLANTPPRDESKTLRKTAEQLHFEAWGSNL